MKKFLCMVGNRSFSVAETYTTVEVRGIPSHCVTVVDDQGDRHELFIDGDAGWGSTSRGGGQALFEVVEEKEWDGNGYPAVGETFEAVLNGECGILTELTTTAVGKTRLLATDWKGVEWALELTSEFRPLKPKAQRDRDELARLVVARGTPQEVADHIIGQGWRKS